MSETVVHISCHTNAIIAENACLRDQESSIESKWDMKI